MSVIPNKSKSHKFKILTSRYIDDGTVGSRIRAQRIRVGLKQRELAKKLGVNKNLVSKWETGKKIPTEKEMQVLEEALDSKN